MRLSLPLAVTGLAAIAAAGVVRFGLLPAQAQLPDDLDNTSTYAGTVRSFMDSSALAAGNLDALLLTDLPATVTLNTTVTGTDGGTADVAQDATIALPDGTAIVESSSTYLVDRGSMEEVGELEGLVLGWPIGTEQRDYTGWSGDLQAPVDLTFVRTEKHAGMDTLVFQSEFEGRIVGEDVLARFPAALPKALLPQVSAALSLPDAIASQLPTLIEVLPDEVPMQYQIASSTTYWVDPTTGIVIDLVRDETRTTAFDVEGVEPAPLAEVFSIRYSTTEAGVAQNVADAQDAGSQLFLFGTVLPIGLIAVGVALLVAAGIVSRRPDRVIELDVTQTRADATRADELIDA